MIERFRVHIGARRYKRFETIQAASDFCSEVFNRTSVVLSIVSTPKQSRIERFLPNGVPRFIRIYDNGGETADRYTVVFTGRYRHKTGGVFWNIGMSGAPFHPQGIGSVGETDRQIDRPTYSHLGKRIKWDDLPADSKKYTLQVYRDLHDLAV